MYIILSSDKYNFAFQVLFLFLKVITNRIYDSVFYFADKMTCAIGQLKSIQLAMNN